MASFPPIGGGGTGGGLVYPDSATRPFPSNSARNTWANNNKQDLIKDTTVVNVGGNQWWLWSGESNPASVDSSLWMESDQIVQGEQGEQGVGITTLAIDTAGDLLVGKTDSSSVNAGRARGESAYEVWVSLGNTGTEQDYIDALKGDAGQDGDFTFIELTTATHGNFFSTDWTTTDTNVYGMSGLGTAFSNTPFPLNASTTYGFEIVLVNEPNQYSIRVTAMTNADFANSGRYAILAGETKTAAEAIGWKLFAFDTDAVDPTKGFELESGTNTIGLNNDGALTVRDSSGDEHNAVDNGADTIRIGSPSLELELRTNQERITVQNAGSDNQLAYITDIPSPTNPIAPSRFAYQVRESEYTLTSEDIQQEVILSVQPLVTVGTDDVTTITFPNQATFTDHYHIPDVNDADAGTKPSIESFRFSLWAHYFQNKPVKIILKSDGDWLPFVSSEILDEYQGIYLYRESQTDANELHTFAFMRPLNANPDVGLEGWSFHTVHPYSWIPLNNAPPSNPPISTLGTFMVDGNESEHMYAGDGLTASHDDQTGETTLSATPMSVDALPTEMLVTSTGINSEHDPLTNTTTLSVDPTNIDLSGYAELEKDVVFSKVTIKNDIDPLFESVINVTNGGNTEAKLVGTTTLVKVNKNTGDTTDILSVNGTSGAVDLKTDITYQGLINNDKSPVTKEYLEEFGRGIGVPSYITVEGGNTYQQTSAVAAYENSGTNINDITIEIDTELVESETIISMPSDSYVSTKNFEVFQGDSSQGTSKNIRSGDTWKVRGINNNWLWEKVYTGGGNVVYGLSGRLDIVEDVSVKAFAYAEGMPYHLLLETPTSSRLFHEFPSNKTFVFSPNATARTYVADVVINESNQGVATGDLFLGQYSDMPLYIIEPNVVISRDQRAWINFPANMSLDVSNGFYMFGTVSGWCGNSRSEGNVSVFVGSRDNNRSYSGSIGIVIGNTGLYLTDGQNLRTPDNSSSFMFNKEAGVTHMYRYAFYVAPDGLMTYYVVDLNDGQVSTGTQQCTLSTLGSNPKAYVVYDRYSNNTAAIAIAETHLVVNPSGSAESRWNWRN